MSLYIDIAFIDEFKKRTDLENDIVEDFNKFFLKKVRGIEITINLETVSELEVLSEANRIYADLLEINPSIFVNKNWKEEIINPKTIFERNPIKLFLLSNDDNCSELEKKYGILFINNKNLIEKWATVRINREVSELTPENSISPYSFNSWENLIREAHPFQELLILDLFLLEDKTNQRLANNIIPLIKKMRALQERSIKVIVFTDRILNSPNGSKYEKLEEAFNIIRKDTDIDLCIIHYDKESKTSYQKGGIFLAEHDREIYTNYLKLKSGSGWNLFNSQNQVAGNRTSITIQSLFRNDVRNSAKKAFENLKIYKHQINNGVEKLIYGKFDESGNVLKKKEYLHHPTDARSILLQC